GTAVTGTYGSVTIDGDGTWSYALDNSDPDANALAKGAAATGVCTSKVTGAKSATACTTLIINITGTNDAPIAVADTNGADAVTKSEERRVGKELSAQPSATDNVHTNDTDVDTGYTKAVSAVNGSEANVGTGITGTNCSNSI